jgi:hypothetical protein
MPRPRHPFWSGGKSAIRMFSKNERIAIEKYVGIVLSRKKIEKFAIVPFYPREAPNINSVKLVFSKAIERRKSTKGGGG